MKKALVLGAGGFIGGFMVDKLKSLGYFVRGVDVKFPEFDTTKADEFFIRDLRDLHDTRYVFGMNGGFDEVYQFAANMGGATYINSGNHDADVMSDSVTINVNVAKASVEEHAKALFFPSSACVYRATDELATCEEDDVYPAFPDNQYGWEKLFSERMYKSFQKQYGLNVKIARFHSIVGERSSWMGGKEKAHSALIRKVITAAEGGSIEVIGDGKQIRTFLHAQDCVDAVHLLVHSNIDEPVNIGSEYSISINDYVDLLRQISGKKFSVKHIQGATGVSGRLCSIDKFYKATGWKPKKDLLEATTLTYKWIETQING